VDTVCRFTEYTYLSLVVMATCGYSLYFYSVYIFKFGGYGHVRILSVFLQCIHIYFWWLWPRADTVCIFTVYTYLLLVVMATCGYSLYFYSVYIFTFGGYGQVRILSVCLRCIHMKDIRQIKLGSSSKDLARVSEKPVSNLSCDDDYPYRESPCF
jgi:hypothetical protein